MKIISLHPHSPAHIYQLERLLIDTFGESRPGKWLQSIHDSFTAGRISLVAIDDNDNVIGWVGGIKRYSGNVWELHPLVVRSDHRKMGIGSRLVQEFELKVKENGGLTVWLGSDDEDGSTSLSNVDLYDNLYDKIQRIETKTSHPYEFYQKLGYTIVGVLPDANGYGKPDIFLAKRVQ